MLYWTAVLHTPSLNDTNTIKCYVVLDITVKINPNYTAVLWNVKDSAIILWELPHFTEKGTLSSNVPPYTENIKQYNKNSELNKLTWKKKKWSITA